MSLRRRKPSAVHREALEHLVRARRFVARHAFPATSKGRTTEGAAWDSLVRLEELLDELRGLADRKGP